MMNRFQRVRAKVFLTIIGIIRHMTIGTRVVRIAELPMTEVVMSQ